VQIVLDGRNSNTAGSAGAAFAAIVQRFNTEHQGIAPPIAIETRAWFNPNLETRWHLVPSLIASLSMLQTLLLTALSVAREREEGTFDQLLVTPLHPLEIMVGKALPPVLIGLAQATLVLCVSLFWFRIPLAGSLVTLYAGLALFTTASVGIGLSISALSANMQQAMLYTFVLVMPMMLLSGLTTPVQNMPDVLQVATLANPLRFAIDLVQRVYLEGVGLGSVLGDLAPMAVIAVVTLPLAAWLFRHKLA
jgi:ABC-2 type transport system permease protein